MPMFVENTVYKLLYLDTNALSNFVENTKDFRVNLERKCCKQLDNNYILCFNINSIIELKKGCKERYDSFIQIFSHIPCLLFMLYPEIIKEEVEYANTKKFHLDNIAFLILPIDIKQYNLQYIISKLEENGYIKKVKEDEEKMLSFMNDLKNNYSKYTKRNKKYEIEIVEENLKYWGFHLNGDIDLNYFPAIRMMNKSYYDRIVNGKKSDIVIGDIHDIMISSVTPYVDVIITEKYQLNVIKESKKFIPQIEKLECYKVSEFYSK